MRSSCFFCIFEIYFFDLSFGANFQKKKDYYFNVKKGKKKERQDLFEINFIRTKNRVNPSKKKKKENA